MKLFLFSIVIFTFFACNSDPKEHQEKTIITENINPNKIQVLNFGSIHLSGSTDAHSSITDISNPKVKLEIKKIVDRLVHFKPTVICVEIPPKSTKFINETYQKYKINQNNKINYSEEVNVIGLEVARLSGTKKIYGIDNPIGFNYPALINLANGKVSDSLYVESIMKNYEKVNKKPLLEQFFEINTKEYKMETYNFYNFLGTMHSPNNFEGADIISEFYKRNLRMYTNFSDIPLTKKDRVLIIMGVTHTAYFDIFIENNPKYQLRNITNYTDYK